MSIEAIAGFSAAGGTILGVAFAAFFWLLSLIRSESRAARSEAREDNATLREEMREDNARLREDYARLREEMREDNARLREELRENNARLREELQGSNERLRQELLTEIREGNRRILEAFFHHRHDPDGTVSIYPPQAAD